VSRIVERDDPEYYPPRVGRRAEEALRAAGHPASAPPPRSEAAPHDPPPSS